jgi:hypothetical protein
MAPTIFAALTRQILTVAAAEKLDAADRVPVAYKHEEIILYWVSFFPDTDCGARRPVRVH